MIRWQCFNTATLQEMYPAMIEAWLVVGVVRVKKRKTCMFKEISYTSTASLAKTFYSTYSNAEFLDTRLPIMATEIEHGFE